MRTVRGHVHSCGCSNKPLKTFHILLDPNPPSPAQAFTPANSTDPHRHTSLDPISSHKVTVASFVPQAPEQALFREHTRPDNKQRPDRSFAATGPRLWNSLPSQLQHSDNGYNDFKRQLKTFLFG